MNSLAIDEAFESNDPKLLTSVGNAMCQHGRFAEAIDAFKRAVEADRCCRDAWQNLAVVYQLQGEIGEAVQACLRYLALQPDDENVLYNLGLMYKDLGRDVDAMQAFATAEHYLKPDDAESATRLGSARLFQNQCDSALDALHLALELDPDYLPALYYAGVCRLMLGDVDATIDRLERVVAREPAYPQAAENLAVAYMTAGRPEDAVPLLESLASDAQAPASVAENLAIAYQDLNQHQQSQGVADERPCT
jgi:Flp pilus assembly protein TadD